MRGSANSLAVRFAEVTHRARDADVAAVLEELAWRGTEDEIENIRAPYLRGDGRLFALETVEGVPSLGIRVGDAVTCIGVRWSDEGAELRLVATRGPLRGRGLASQLIAAVVDALQVESVWAETDRDAVEFYRKAGFAVRSLGEKHPGMERFHCTLRLHPEIYKCSVADLLTDYADHRHLDAAGQARAADTTRGANQAPIGEPISAEGRRC